MKKTMQKTISTILVVLMCLTLAPLQGFVDFDWNLLDFCVKASAATEGYYTYTVSNGKATIIDVDKSISGDITIPSILDGYSVITIGNEAFYDCESLTSVTIPDSVITIGENAFDRCYGLTNIVVDKDNKHFYSDENGVLFDKNKTNLIKYPAGKMNNYYTIPDSVITIGENAFNSSDLTNVTIPNSVTTICLKAFYYCERLTSVTIGNSVTTIEEYAFSGCHRLTSIVVDKDNKYFCSDENGVLFDKNRTKLIQYPIGKTNNEYTIPDSVTTIGELAFFDCDSLTCVTIGDGVTTIGESAFHWCKSLISVIIGDSVTTICSKAFYDCESLTSVTIGNSVTTIGECVFYDCVSLTNVTIPDSVIIISDAAFNGCESLTSITIPNSVTTIGDNAFSNCKRLKSITIPDSVTTMGNWFSNCDSLTSVTIPDSVTIIDSWAFSDCDSLTSVTIPDSVTIIGDLAFNGCESLTSITIPNSVTTIDTWAFSDCDSLLFVYYCGTEDQWNGMTIETGNECLTNANIHFIDDYIWSASILNVLDNKNQKITITPKDATGNFNSQSTTSEFLRKAFEKLKNVTVRNALGISANVDSYTALKSEIETENMTLTCDNFYDYIIPKEVISSWSTSNGTAYKFDALMQKDKKDGKPYVSTVFGRSESDKPASGGGSRSVGSNGGPYKELKSNKLNIYQDEKYDIIISAGGLNGKSATFYISQDNAHKISNSTGVFDSKILYTVLDYNKDTYVYFVTSDGITSDPVKVNIVKCAPLDDYTKSLLNGSEISLIGKDGQKIKISDDFPLVGGAEISLEAFKFPYMGVDVNGDNVKISLGIDVFSSKESSGSKGSEKTWLDFKKGISTLGDKYEDSKDALKHYRNFVNTFASKNGLVKPSYSVDSASFNLSLLGYLEGTIVNGKIVFKEALIKVEGKFTFKYTQQGAIWVVPAYVYVEASSKVGLTSNMARQFADTNIPLDFGFMLDIEPAVKIGAGAGVKDAASLGLWGKGSLPYHNDFSEKYHNLYLKGEFGWEAEFFIVSAEGTLLEGDFKLLDSYYGQSKKLLLRSFEDDYINKTSTQTKVSVVSRDYAEDTSEWLGEYPISLYSLADNGVSFNVLQTSIFDQTNPQLVSFGDNVMMTWIQDDTSRDTYNRMKLVYSLYDAENDSWTEPKAVYDDGHNDAYPSLATDGENVYVTWQKIDKTVTESDATSVDVFLKNSEIYVAKYDAVNDCFINATKLTDNEVYDYIPSIVLNNDKAVVYYAANSNNNLMGTDNNTLYRYELGKTAEVLAEKQSYIISATPEIVNGTEKLSYSVDTDGDMSTSNDITVNTISNGTTTAFGKGENEVAYIFADYSMLDGKETLFVSDMNNIYYEQNGETKTVFNGSRLIEGNISFVEQETGLSILWTENNEVGGNEFWTTSYEDGEWTEPIQISNIGSFKVSKVDITMLGGKLVGICNMNEMTLDEDSGTYIEGDANLCSFIANDFTDISVDIYMVDESTIIPGETSSIDVYVNNVGTTDISTIEFTLSDTLETNTTVSKEVNIKSGATELVTIDYPVPENYASTTLSVSASIPGVEESDIEDNTESIEIGNSDLSIIESELVNFGDNYIFKAVIENNSSVDAEGIVVSVIFNDSEEEAFDQNEIGTLAKEQYVDYELAFNKELIEFDENGVGKLYIKATSTSDESADGDNMICVAVTLPQETECAHPLIETIAAKEATCTEIGYDEYTVCNGCNEKLTEYVEYPMIDHEDEDRDNLCDSCGKTMNDISVGETKTIEIKSKEITYLKFIPSESTEYTFSSLSDTDTYGYLYDADKEQLAYNDDGGSGNNFSVTYTLTAGETYYWGARFYSSSKSGSFDVTLTMKEPCKHEDTETDNGTTANCTSIGYTEGVYCYDCEQYISGHEEIGIDANAHNWDNGTITTTATCKVSGVKTYICQHNSEHTKTVNLGVNISNHVNTKNVAEEKATCSTKGYAAGVYCNDCEKYISGHEEIAIDADAHMWDNGTITTTATCKVNGVKTYTCQHNASHKKTENLGVNASNHVNTKNVAEVKATCTTKGFTAGVYCNDCQKYISGHAEIPATGHTAVTDKGTAATCTEAGKTDGSYCSVCNAVFKAQEEIPAKGHTTVSDKAVAATCTTAGKTEGSHCSVCNAVIKAQENIPAKGHTAVTDKAVAVTCTTAGKTEGAHCSVCNAVIKAQENIPAKGHTAVTDKAVAVTCTTAGKTEGSHCSVCNTIITAQKNVPATGHKWNNGAITTAATCKAKGVKTYTCQNDATHKKTEEIAVNASNHVNTKNVPETPATFENIGYTAGVYCNDCKKYISGHMEIPKLVPEFTDSKDAKESGNNIISNNGLTVAQLLSQAGKGAVIKTIDGKSVENAALIGTGMVITMADGSKKEIVVYGDSDGDGKISAADARLALRASVGLEKYSEDSCYYKAANVESKDKLSAADARLILRASVGLEDPKSWLK